MNGRNSHELKWRLLRSFFRSRAAFLDLFAQYERRVMAFADQFETDRTRLKLPIDELLSLLDFKRLEELRDREILLLKETAHEIFRGPDATDRFDHYVSNIYHELSILKEEHYTLREDFVRFDQKEYDRFFREVSEFYPKRLRHVKNLYGHALRRLETILPGIAHERILVRSLYLFGDELLTSSYRGGLPGLYRKMYPDGGAPLGYFLAAGSFFESGFLEEALGAYRKAQIAGAKERSRGPSEKRAELLAEIDRKIEELSATSER